MTKPGPHSRALIVGGGIGGLTTALAFARNGMSSTVLERSAFAEETGAGIQLGPNATHALAELGVLDAIAAAAFTPDVLRLFDGLSGASLASVPLGRVAEERYGAPYLTLHRADLHAGLLAACRGDGAIELRTGFEVTEAETLAEPVFVRGADGTRIEGSALVAADGLWSRLRDRIAPDAGLRFSGATAWRALLPRREAQAPFDAPEVGLWLGPRAHLVHYPVRGGKDLNIVAVVEGGSAKQGWSRRAEADVLLRSFQRWAQPAKDLLEMVETWRCWSLIRLKPLPRWTDGRMALLGDAAHPVLPYLAQGAALAIEDAVVLAASLKAAGGDALAAFPRYQSLRMERAARVQAQAARFGRIYHLRGPLAFARNFLLGRRRPESLLQSFDWLYGNWDT
ncbi:FAD-dependent monooxygenase [Methyloceanibacter sp.]|uniref:FAD-dependent monooxygenase n=1 Tax=Methyloceanibacter sp. TaxID=1965321 RepID=UPI003D6CDA2E